MRLLTPEKQISEIQLQNQFVFPKHTSKYITQIITTLKKKKILHKIALKLKITQLTV